MALALRAVSYRQVESAAPGAVLLSTVPALTSTGGPFAGAVFTESLAMAAAAAAKTIAVNSSPIRQFTLTGRDKLERSGIGIKPGWLWPISPLVGKIAKAAPYEFYTNYPRFQKIPENS